MIFLVIVPCILCFVYAWIRRQKYLQGKLPPYCAGAWPVVGHLHLWIKGLFWSRLLELQKDCTEKGGVTYSYSGTNSAYTYYGICDPEACSNVANACNQKALLCNDFYRAVTGEGLATSSGNGQCSLIRFKALVNSVSVWENHRQLLIPVFEQLCSRLEAINHQAKNLVERINERSDKGPFDQTPYLRQATMNILFSAVFGINEELSLSQRNHIETYQIAMHKISKALFERHNSFFMHKNLIFNCSRIKRVQEECLTTIKNVTKEIITMKKAEINKPKIDCITNNNCDPTPCLLDALMLLESRGSYSEKQVEDEVTTFILNGYEPIVNSLTFSLVLLGSHLEVQEKVYLEIENICKTKLAVDTEDFTKLRYLEAVVLETLRLYPPITAITRVVDSAMDIKKYTLDPGAQCLLFIYEMNRHPAWGKDKDTFRPERWLEDLEGRVCGTFGMGRRLCIGKNLALNTMKIILVHLIREFKVTSDHTKMVVHQKLLLTPALLYHIALERRIYKQMENKIINLTDTFL